MHERFEHISVIFLTLLLRLRHPCLQNTCNLITGRTLRSGLARIRHTDSPEFTVVC